MKHTILVLALIAASATPVLADWSPKGPIKMMIAFRAGGGADTQARLLAEDLKARHGWKVVPVNVTGAGGAKMAAALKKEPADGLSIGIAVIETFAYNLQATRRPGYRRSDFRYLATITGTQMGLIAKASRGWKTLADVIEAAKSGKKITAGAMSPKLADGLYVIGKANGVKFSTVMVKGGKGGLNGVFADDLDIAWAAGVQTKGVKSGDLVNLVSAEAGPLRISPDAPPLSTFNVPFTFGSKFVVVAPAKIPEAARKTYARAIAAIVNDPKSKVNRFVSRAFSGPDVVTGAALEKLVDEKYDAAAALLDESSK